MERRPHLFIGVQDGEQEVLRGEQGAFFLEGEAGQEATLLVVTLRRLFAQPGHRARVGFTGAKNEEEKN